MGPTDEELMSAYVAGDARAFEKLFARLAPRVHAFFRRSFRDEGVADDLRRRFRLPEDADEDVIARADAQPQPDPPLDTDVKDAVRAALDALPESQRTVIHLHRYEGMTFAEIAAVLCSTPGAVKLRAFRGYETLRQRLKGLL